MDSARNLGSDDRFLLKVAKNITPNTFGIFAGTDGQSVTGLQCIQALLDCLESCSGAEPVVGIVALLLNKEFSGVQLPRNSCQHD
jgi:hypothetical protein